MDDFARRTLAWFDRHGRRHLPWQQQPTPYRAWVSEIMLQQTQVTTVVPYYQRFIASFPAIADLAAAPVDAVLHHWSGLGYYARARNLHRTAQEVMADHDGELPADIDALSALPGIGRSTAGAILALAHGTRHAILDGNVKRVLARYHGIEGWPGQTAVARQLWARSEQHTPTARVAHYTQAMMDLGATVCLRARPLCQACPHAGECVARRDGRSAELPGRKPKRNERLRQTVFLLLRDDAGHLLLERRPPSGIWGGLWGFPECAPDADPVLVCRERFGLDANLTQRLATVHHSFTHFDLAIAPVLLDVARTSVAPGVPALEGPQTLWYNPKSPQALGLAAPVARLIELLTQQPRS